MTGFFGVLQFGSSPLDTDSDNRLLDRIRYCGADLQLVVQLNRITLGIALQRITDDTREEMQPLTIDGVTIVTNAYLVNRAELIEHLRAQGIPAANLYDAPDPELILHAYFIWRDDCPRYLKGTFAFAIWDANEQQLLLAVDHIGQSLLYYAVTPDALVFSTELGAVRLFPGVDGTIDEWAVAYRLLLRFLDWQDLSRTPFTGIRQLKPAEAWRINARLPNEPATRGKPSPYWTMPLDDSMLVYPRFSEYVDHYRELLLSIVHDSMRSKRLVISLSGGIDSPSLAAAICMMQARGSSTEVSAINEGFHYLHGVREPHFAWLAARKLDIPITFIQGDSYQVVPPLPATMDISCLTQPGLLEDWMRAVQAHGNVIWYGDGPDEIFAVTPLLRVMRRLPLFEGLRLYRQVWEINQRRPALGLRRYFRHAWADNRARRAGRLPPPYYTGYPAWFNPDFERRMDLKAIWEARWSRREEDIHPLQPVAHNALFNLRWQRELELVEPMNLTPPRRYNPFLDVRMLRFGLSLPPQLSMKHKHLMREAMRDILPNEILNRTKEPLGYPLTSILRQPGAEWVDDWQPIPDVTQYIRREAVPKIVGWDIDPASQMTNFLPFMLNNWLQAIQAAF